MSPIITIILKTKQYKATTKKRKKKLDPCHVLLLHAEKKIQLRKSTLSVRFLKKQMNSERHLFF